jgi:glycosyltransferase involved in cell wall biosynthesis
MERQLIDYSDLVVVTAKRLYNKLEAVQPVLIPNGADYDHFSQLPAPGSLKQFTRPIIGYYGAISDWFDAGTVAYAASQRPDWTFVLIGSTLGANIKVLESQSNIHLLGERPYSVLPAYLADFDVCTIPFLRTPLTEATHPVKFFEYISSGKPVVAKVLPELEPYADIAYLYETREEFLGCLETALAERDDTLVERRRAVARQNRWDDRYTAMATAIRNLYGCSSSL